MQGTIKATFPTGIIKEVEIGSSIIEVLGTGKEPGEPIIAIVDDVVTELSKSLHYDVKISPVTIRSPLGRRTYMRSLTFLLICSVKHIFKEARISIEHSLGEGLYGEIDCDKKIDENAETYWIEKEVTKATKESLEKQY